MGNEYYEPYSVDSYKGLKFGEIYKIKNKNYMIYRLNDKRNEVTLLSKHNGFQYVDVDEFLKRINKKTT